MNAVPFYSRRNQVFPTLWQGTAAVEKHFPNPDDWARERNFYEKLRGKVPIAAVRSSRPGLLILEYVPAPSLLTVLERQEEEGFEPRPWQAFGGWLLRCHSACGAVPGEGNMRNFLWDGETITGIDLESYREDASPQRYFARQIAAILTYDPPGTPVKRAAAALLRQMLAVPEDLIKEEYITLRARRMGGRRRMISGIVLAGGKSRRMGKNKASLQLEGKTLLQRQVEKMRNLGIQDILLSGEGFPSLPGTRVIPDRYPGQGPLSGLYECLQSAQCGAALVLSVDTPLIPLAVLAQLCRCHSGSVTVLRHEGWEEPLTGVYEKDAAGRILPLLQEKRNAVRGLKDVLSWNCFDYFGPEALLKNCNTPAEFAAATGLARDYAAAGLAW